MKKSLFTAAVATSTIALTSCGGTKFTEVYNLSDDHVYTDASYKEVDKILTGEYEGGYVLLFGFNSCPYCQALVPELDSVAKDEYLHLKDDGGLFKPAKNKIYYYNIKDDRTDFNDQYKNILTEVGLEIPADGKGVAGISRISVPYLVTVKDGEILKTLMWDDSYEYDGSTLGELYKENSGILEDENVLADLESKLRPMIVEICGCN